MKSTVIAIAAAAGSAYAQQSAYGQCGGKGWTGATTCVSGYHCEVQNPYYSQCVYGAAATTAAAVTKASSTLVTKASSSVVKPTTSTVVKPTTTSAVVKSTTTSVAKPVTTSTKASTTAIPVVATSAKVTSTTAAAAVATTAAATKAASSGVQFAGINISGFDFGCGTDGTCVTSGILNPGSEGISQMEHFVKDDGLNTFRLPVGWQYLVNNVLGGTLDTANLAEYDALVQGCISAGAELCVIDIHNYARWNGAIIGQGGPTNAQFESLWTQLATKYKGTPKVAFGIMNEPHDLTVSTWATTVQGVVTAIRNAGATSNKILLPGSDWTHASKSISDGSADALLAVKNLDGTTTDLIFDVHQYLDSDGSGTSTSCATNNVDVLTTFGNWLRTNNRQGMLTETGGGASDSSCITDVCAELSYLMNNADVYLGWHGWAAGMFSSSTYALTETPTGSAGSYVDQELVTKCIAGIFNGKTALS